MTGPMEYLLLRCVEIVRRQDTLKAEHDALAADVEALRVEVAKLRRQLERSRYLRNLWTIRCHKARDNRDMWRARALNAHGTKRRMRSTPDGDETANAGPW